MGYKTYTCPHAKRCGGCELLAVPYPLQLRRKQQAMEELFSEVIEREGPVLQPIVGMDEPIAYRHKAATPFAPGKRMRCGFFERGSHRITYCAHCLVEAPDARETLCDVAHVADALRIPAYNEDRGQGLLRHAIVRRSHAAGTLLLVVVTAGPKLPHATEFVRRLRKRHPNIASVVQNVNTRRTNAMLGTRNNVLFGPGVVHDELLGCSFEIGPTSFFQTNPVQTERLYALALEQMTDAQTLLDAYCGTGTIGICAAHANPRLQVVGVEQVSDAVGCARKNARTNAVQDRCSFACADATEWMANQRRASFDAIVLDPPRAGSTREFLDGVARLSPRLVSYVSCNPATQVRDMAVLREHGYRVTSITPVDMFPHTKHVETVCLLTRI